MKILLLAILLLTTTVFANIGKVTALKGEAVVIRDTKTLNLNLGFVIEEKDQIKTFKNSRLQLQFKDKTIISLGKNSIFNVEEYFFDEQQPKKTKASFKMAKGIFKSITGRIGKINPGKFKLKTKSASIGIRGTVFFGEVAPNTPDSIACTTGQIFVETDAGSVEVLAGELTTVIEGQIPTPPIKIPKSQVSKLQKESGANESEKESGQNEQTVEKEKSSPIAITKKSQDAPTITPTIDAVDTAKDEKEAENNSKKIDKLISDNPDPITPDPDPITPDPDPITPNPDNSGLKTANFKGFHSGSFVPLDGNNLADENSYYELPKNNASFHIQNGVLNATIEMKRYKANVSGEELVNIPGLNDTFTFILSSIFLDTHTTTYTGYSKIYDDTNSNSNTMNTQFFIDSRQQFFVAKGIGLINIDGQDYKYSKDIVFGRKSNINDIPTSGVTHYTQLDNSINNNPYVTTNGTYVNWKSNRLLKYEITDSGVLIVMGNAQSDQNGNAQLNVNLYQRNNDFDFKINSTSSEMYLFGGEQQGWGGNVYVSQEGTSNHIAYTYGEFKDTNYFHDNTPTDSVQLTGFANDDLNLGKSLSLTLNRSSGISAIIDNTLTANAFFTAGTASYITDNIFAFKGFNGTLNATNVNDGWLLAIDSGSLYSDKDDQISWGFWNAEYSVGGGVNSIDTQAWVAAQNIVEDISTLGTGTASYAGQAMGFLNNETYIDPSKSTMQLDFDFGANKIDATLNINNTKTMTANFADVDLSNNTSAIYSAEIDQNKIKGSFANDGAVTFGTFNFNDGVDTAIGAYKGKKD